MLPRTVEGPEIVASVTEAAAAATRPGTPVVGGLTSDQALKIIRGLGGMNLVGFDLVEVAPAFDHAELTSLAGATLALEFLYVLASNLRNVR